jgi:hypothetical protein
LSASAMFFWASAASEKLRSWMHTYCLDFNTSNSHVLQSRNYLCCTLPSTKVPTETLLGNPRKLKQHGHTFSSAYSCHLGGGGARGSCQISASGASPGRSDIISLSNASKHSYRCVFYSYSTAIQW